MSVAFGPQNACVSLPAAANLNVEDTAYKVVTINSSGQVVLGGNAGFIGVARAPSRDAAAGSGIDVQTSGLVTVVTDNATPITAGQGLDPQANGKVRSGGTATAADRLIAVEGSDAADTQIMAMLN